MIVSSNVFKTISMNTLAEKGMNVTLPMQEIMNEKLDPERVKRIHELKAMKLPEGYTHEEAEITFVDPERIKREELAKKEKEMDPSEKPKAPVSSMNNVSTYGKRAKFMENLRMQAMEPITFEEILARNKETTLHDLKRKKKTIDITSQHSKNEEEDNNENEEDENIDKDQDLNMQKIRELEGDIEEAEGEDPDYEPEVEGEEKEEGEKEEEKKDDSKSMLSEDNSKVSEIDFITNEARKENLEKELTEEEKKRKAEIEKEKAERHHQKVAQRIKQRIRAAKFLDNEAELGSDHEMNDQVQKKIDNEDAEEIIDKRLEFEEGDIENLIDNTNNEKVNKDQLASKFVEDDAAQDRADIVQVVAAMKRKGRRGRRRPSVDIDDENASENVLSKRMQDRKQMYDKEKNGIKFNSDASSKKQIDKVCDSEEIDEEERAEIQAELGMRKERRIMKQLRQKELNENWRENLRKSAQENKKLREQERVEKEKKKLERESRLSDPNFQSSSISAIRRMRKDKTRFV